MKDKQQSEPLRIAALLEKTRVKGSLRDEAAAELRRQYAELVDLRTGYAAARLEIESLRARSAEPAGEYPVQEVSETLRSILIRCRNFIDTTKVPAYPAGADLADEIDVLLAAQPAGAPQPGAAYAALPDERAAFEAWIKKDCGDLSTFGSGQNIHYSNSAVNNAWTGWKLRASHGQASAQAAPAAVAGPSDLRARCEEILAWRKTGVLHGDALRTLAREKYGNEHYAIQLAERDTETEALNVLVSAPTTQPAPQQDPSHTAQGDTTDVVDVPDQCPYFGPSPHRDVWLAGWYAARAAQVDAALTQAARDVLAERQRQISAEGYDADHDDAHVNDEIAAMAALFVMPPGAREWDASSTSYGDTLAEAILPQDWEMPALGDRRRELVRGAAMALAELERIDRADAARAAQEGK